MSDIRNNPAVKYLLGNKLDDDTYFLVTIILVLMVVSVMAVVYGIFIG